MDHDEFDSFQPHDDEYPLEDEELGPSAAETRVTVTLSWQQIGFILAINAIVSLIISVAVVIVAGSGLPSRSGAAARLGTSVAGRESSTFFETGDETGRVQSTSPETQVTPLGGTIPAAQPAAVETPPATLVEPTSYIVQPGDTLSSIASRFQVSLEDLMRANGLSNPDYVQGGQELLVPIGGLPPATPTFTPVPIPTDTPLPFNPPTPLPSGTAPPAEPAATVGPTSTPVPTLTPAPGSEIRLVVQVLNPGDLANEMVQIVNQGPFVRLTGWTLSDEAGVVYTFPDFSLWGGGAINIHTTGGSNTITDLYWDQPNAVWEAGELVTLSDAEGTLVASYAVPAP